MANTPVSLDPFGLAGTVMKVNTDAWKSPTLRGSSAGREHCTSHG